MLKTLLSGKIGKKVGGVISIVYNMTTN